jgi:predicted NAD/FAD-dependent oxidoreductase
VFTVWAAWPQRWWPDFNGVFVHDSRVLTWVADSGKSRNDGVAVLSVHSTGEFATERLHDPASAIEPMLAELGRVIGERVIGERVIDGRVIGEPVIEVPPPLWQRVHRWSFASAREPHPEPFRLVDLGDPGAAGGGLIGVCGDAWGPRSRVEQGWLSGDDLARVLLERLTVSS